MNSKEQTIEKGIQIVQKWWCDANCNVCAEEAIKEFCSLPSVVIIEGDEGGLLPDKTICKLGCTEYPTEEDIKFDGGCGTCGLGRKIKRTIQAQKALTESIEREKYKARIEGIKSILDDMTLDNKQTVAKLVEYLKTLEE
jgi:hypothetical protein